MKNKKKQPDHQRVLLLAVIVAVLLISSLARQRREDAEDAASGGSAPLTTLAPKPEKTPSPETAAPQTQDGSADTAKPSDAPEAISAEADEETYAEYPEEITYTGGEVTEDGTYSSAEDVAYYLHAYGHLPDNYITKSEAEDEGWVSYEGNLWDVEYGACIGGDRFGNREGLLPKGEQYYECDVNYDGGYRGEERLIYTADGDVYYTADHYQSFEKLY